VTTEPATPASERPAQGPKYTVVIDGQDYPWNTPTITVPELRALASIEAGTEIIEINLDDNTEATLSEDAVVALKPGQGFGKKIRFRRG